MSLINLLNRKLFLDTEKMGYVPIFLFVMLPYGDGQAKEQIAVNT